DALFHVPDGAMAIGLGIHGEPGIDEQPMPSAQELARILVDGVLEETPELASDRVAVVLNGLGTVKHEEMFVVWKHASRLLAEAGLTVVRPEVGEHVTSLDMAGLSLTVTRLDDELERLWLAPADAPAFRRGGTVPGELGEERGEIYTPGEDPIPAASEGSRASARSSSASRSCWSSSSRSWGAWTRSPGTATTGRAWCSGSGPPVRPRSGPSREAAAHAPRWCRRAQPGPPRPAAPPAPSGER